MAEGRVWAFGSEERVGLTGNKLRSRGTGNVIIIDDARLFGANPGYPTLEEVDSLVKEWQPYLDVEVKLDSKRVTPRES
jgi:hypothetical protein